MSLKKLSVSKRFILIIAAALVSMLVLAALGLNSVRNVMEENNKKTLRSLVETAHGVVMHFVNLEREGKMSRSQAQAAAIEALLPLRYDSDEYYYIWTMDGVSVMNPARPDLRGQNMIGKMSYVAGNDMIGDFLKATRSAPPGEGFMISEFVRAGGGSPIRKLVLMMEVESWNWGVGSGIYVNDVSERFRSGALRFGAVVLALLAMLIAFAWWVGRSVTNQLGGEPAHAAQLMQQVADGDLRTVVKAEGDADSLLGALAGMVERLRTMMLEIGRSADLVAEHAREIATASRSVFQETEKETNATAAIAAAIEEMTVSISQITDSAVGAERNSARSCELADQGVTGADTAASEMHTIAATVSEAVARLELLVSRANEVGEIAGVIKEIAAQTNLLALNAAIEAARAGEQGRGFAVVADEVRKLAERTSTATVQIEEVIAGVQSETQGTVDAMSRVSSQVEGGVDLVKSVSESLRAISTGATETLEQAHSVAEATGEQSAAATAVAQEVEQIAQMVERTGASMQSTVTAVELLERLSLDLNQMVARFKV